MPPHTIWYWISDARFRSVHNSRTYLVIRRHFGTDVIFSLQAFPKTLVIPATLLNGENYARSMNVNVRRCGEDVKTIHELPEEPFSGWCSTTILCGGLIASRSDRDNSLGFLRILLATSRKQIECHGVSLHSISAPGLLPHINRQNPRYSRRKPNGGFHHPTTSTKRLIMHKFFCIRFRNLLDGSSCRAHPSNIIMCQELSPKGPTGCPPKGRLLLAPG